MSPERVCVRCEVTMSPERVCVRCEVTMSPERVCVVAPMRDCPTYNKHNNINIGKPTDSHLNNHICIEIYFLTTQHHLVDILPEQLGNICGMRI